MKYLLLFTFLLAYNLSDAKQKFYKWTDADGNTHYSEKKPQQQKTSEVNVSTSYSQPVNYSKNDSSQEEDQTTDEEEKTAEQKAIDEYNKTEKEKVLAKQNKENCKIAKKNLATLQQTVRVRKINPATGEYIRLDDTQRVKMMKTAKKSIKELCRK